MKVSKGRRVAAFVVGVFAATPFCILAIAKAFGHGATRGWVSGFIDFTVIVVISAVAAFTYIGPRYSDSDS